MPHGRHKVPFSGKAKKKQLQEKKQIGKQQDPPSKHHGSRTLILSSGEGTSGEGSVRHLNEQPGRCSTNRYILKFHTETPEEIKRNKEAARQGLETKPEECLEVNPDDFFPPDLHFPTRPPWDWSSSKEELNARENRYFTDFVKTIQDKFEWSELGYFELNLETWRQLWRVLEMSDIILVIADIRFAALMFPPQLYEYVTNTLKKDIILVLNKIDLAPAPLVVAWKKFINSKFPSMRVVLFTSFPSYNMRGNTSNKAGLNIRRRKGRLRMAAEGSQLLLDTCKEILGDKVDLSSWQEKIKEEMSMETEYEDVDILQTIEEKHQDTSFQEHEKYKDGVLTIGCIGQPNAGKSSLMNAIMGRKVVSVSSTPGHTKHFQTIFITKNVRFCDCPGLVFPSKIPRSLQILMGSFPIAQVREPYSTVKFLAERLDLVALLSIQHPEDDTEWSAMDICDGWAKKKGFYTARAARLDTYRAANHILRMALDGKISLCLTPPNYTGRKDFWAEDSEVEKVKWVQARNAETTTLHVVDEGDDEDIKADSDQSDESLSSEEGEEENLPDVPLKQNRFDALK